MKLKNIVTDRLILIPITLKIAEALINGDNSEVLKLGINTNKAWPTSDTMDILPIIVETLKNSAPSGFETWMIERKDSKEIIGDIGFHGMPDENGEVEIGYGLVESERRNGFGFEAARAIMDFAIAHEAVKVIKADCLINNIPSAKILEKLEMQEVNRDDELIYWKYDKEIESIMKISSECKYNSMEYCDLNDISDAKVFVNTKDSIFLYKKINDDQSSYWLSKSKDNVQVYWAAQSEDKFFDGLNKLIKFIKENDQKTEKLYMEFIPEEFLHKLQNYNSKIVSEWVDYWSNDLSSIAAKSKRNISIREIREDEVSKVGELTRSCFGYSRGFTGESDTAVKEWLDDENSNILMAEIDGKLVGTCFVGLYGFDSEKGTVLWIRELAVAPNYQSKGIGYELLTYAIDWGMSKGAKRSFLACDAENINALKLYEKFNYARKEERGQINIEIDLK